MKSILIATLTLILVQVLHSQSQHVVFPLHVGDRWEFHNHLIRITGDTILANGKKYSIFLDSGSPFHYFVRQDSNKVYYYESLSDSDEVLHFEFGRNLGDTILKLRDTLSPDIYKKFVTFEGSNDETVFGRVRTVFLFRTIISEYFFDDHWVVDSLGIIRHMWGCLGPCPPIQEELTGAVIQGQKFGTPTNVRLKEGDLTNVYSLQPNYPNPFNSSTILSYQLPTRNYVTLKVFDVLGREIAPLVNGEQTAGYKSVTWDASNVPSGVYFYRLQAGKFTDIKKMLLLK